MVLDLPEAARSKSRRLALVVSLRDTKMMLLPKAPPAVCVDGQQSDNQYVHILYSQDPSLHKKCGPMQSALGSNRWAPSAKTWRPPALFAIPTAKPRSDFLIATPRDLDAARNPLSQRKVPPTKAPSLFSSKLWTQ